MTTLSFVDNVFTEAFQGFTSNFSWANVIILITGMLLGFIIAGCVYLIIFLISIRNTKKVQLENEEVIDDALLKEKIEVIKKDFIHNSEGLAMKEKTSMLGSTIYNVCNTVATYYFPESKYPLYELSVDEIIVILGYISKRLDGIFDKVILRMFRKLTISQVFKIFDEKKKASENKLIKTATKVQPNKVVKVISTALNYANPIYWFRRTVLSTTINFTINKIFLIVIDIVSSETNKAYSKSIYNEERLLMDKEIELSLNEIEKAAKQE